MSRLMAVRFSAYFYIAHEAKGYDVLVQIRILNHAQCIQDSFFVKAHC